MSVLKILILYVATFALILPLCLVMSFFSILPWVHGDSPVYGILWVMVFIAEGAILLPIAIGLSGEIAEKSRQQRGFQLNRALVRTVYALLSETGPLSEVFVWGAAPGTFLRYRPVLLATSWLITCYTVVFAFRVRSKAAAEAIQQSA